MIIHIVPNEPRRGIISITPDKIIIDFLVWGMPIYANMRPGETRFSNYQQDADNHNKEYHSSISHIREDEIWAKWHFEREPHDWEGMASLDSMAMLCQQ